MNPNWLLRMSKWARHPPSMGRVKLVLSVIAFCLALVAIERWIGWPEWLAVNPQPRPKF